MHDDTKLEDTLVSGSVATTNELIDAGRRLSTTVHHEKAKWDDGGVEVDDCLLMETRRWMGIHR